MSGLKSWSDAFLAFFFPEVCQRCENHRARPDQGYLCDTCREGVRLVQPPFCQRCGLPFKGEITNEFECANCKIKDFQFCWARAAMEAADVALDVIHRYKYRGALYFEPFLAGVLIERASPLLQQATWDAIVPVPLHPLKKREREFNQAARLARCLGRSLHIPVNENWLQRVKYTRTQTKLARRERDENVKGAFLARNTPELSGKRIVLVDDVFTTGSTTNACASALRKSGAGQVCVWTVARALI
jgi:ComF family protein